MHRRPILVLLIRRAVLLRQDSDDRTGQGTAAQQVTLDHIHAAAQELRSDCGQGIASPDSLSVGGDWDADRGSREEDSIDDEERQASRQLHCRRHETR